LGVLSDDGIEAYHTLLEASIIGGLGDELELIDNRCLVRQEQ